MIKHLSEKEFYLEEMEKEVDYKAFKKIIFNVIKKFYNYSGIPLIQKQVIKGDSKLKYLIMEVLNEMKIFKVISHQT